MLAEFGTGQVFWSFLWFFMFIIWIYLLIFIFSDIFRSRDLSGWGKALWSIFVILLPFIGIFTYLIVRGSSMAERQVAQVQAQQEAMDSYIRTTAGSASSADQLAQLADLHTAGKIDDAEYATAKAKVLQA
jgi:energy-coupling factor transporter transmembrane protein EcfT